MIFLSIVCCLIVTTPVTSKCRDCCHCCGDDESDIITEEDIKEAERNYVEPDEVPITTEGILKHLNLEEQTLQHIVNDVNSVGNKEEKIKKILEYTVDINWDAPMCPNTLIKQEDNLCSYISYFHLMLNNPYYLKFFLILNNTMRTEDTYVLNAICDAVMLCVQRPTLNKNNMCSVANVIKAVFKKVPDTEEYFYCKKEDTDSPLHIFFFGSKKNDEEWQIMPYKYGDKLSEDFEENVFHCICKDLKIDQDKPIKKKLLNFMIKEGYNKIGFCHKYFFGLLFKYKKQDKKTRNNVKIVSQQLYNQYLNNNKKILGIRFGKNEYHYFSVVNYNGVWYNKDTYHDTECKKISIRGVLELMQEFIPLANSMSPNGSYLSYMLYITDLSNASFLTQQDN
ncbi:MAG: hypothetical protein II393_03680 [Cytophagales bacterium]|nr:hypothetical protein [Cytophagales bacterium]